MGEPDSTVGEVDEVGCFLLREAEGAEAFRAEGDQFGGGEFAPSTGRSENAGEDGAGGSATELLVDDRTRQGGEVRGVVGYGVGTDLANDVAKNGVRYFEIEESFFHGNATAEGRIKENDDTPHSPFYTRNFAARNGAAETSGEG